MFFFVSMFLGANSPGGNAHGREVELPDWVLDYWHPLEKAQYPDYFARREKRKKVRNFRCDQVSYLSIITTELIDTDLQEYQEWWAQQYGKSDVKDGHH